jgi:hypothetical protein
MTPVALLRDLRDRGVTLTLVEGHLCCEGPPEVVHTRLLVDLKRLEPALIQRLRDEAEARALAEQVGVIDAPLAPARPPVERSEVPPSPGHRPRRDGPARRRPGPHRRPARSLWLDGEPARHLATRGPKGETQPAVESRLSGR